MRELDAVPIVGMGRAVFPPSRDTNLFECYKIAERKVLKMVYRPKNPNIRDMLDKVYGTDEDDEFSKRSRMARMMANTTRHNRGNVYQQNADFVDEEMIKKFRESLKELFDERSKSKK